MNQLSVGDPATVTEPAAAAIAAGQFAFENGLCKFYTRAAESGDKVSPMVRGRVKFDKTTLTDTWAIGEDVELDATSQKAVASGGTRAGYCAVASASGDAYVEVMLNELVVESA